MAKSTSSELPDEKFFETIMRRVRDIPFSYVIKMTTGHEVYPVKDEDAEVIDEIFEKAKAVVKKARDEDFSSLRPNEISNKLEDMLRTELKGVIPESKVAGYPNILIERKGKFYYIEVKLAGINEMNSSFRTFYYEPVELAKVTKDACHIIVGFIHRMRTIIGFKIIDASRIRVNLKSEFNTNNKELYRQENILKEYFEQNL